MNLVIVHSLSKHHYSLNIADAIDGDHIRIEPTKRPPRFYPFQLLVCGYQTVAEKDVGIQPLEIDFDKYSDIYLVSPVWAGRVNAYMRQFLKEYPFRDKAVHIIGSCLGGYTHYFDSFEGWIHGSNQIVEKTIYVKGEKKD